MKYFRFILVFLVAIILISCQKEDDVIDVPMVDLEVLVFNEIDGIPLEMNNMKYANAAGNEYEATRVEYYIGDFAFQRMNGDWYRPYFEPYLINGDSTDQTFKLVNVRQGEYQSISFMVGLPESWNKTGKLENNIANYNMAWPESLGGGYHFMKFEGNYIDDEQETRGFTVHLGQNGMQSVNVFDNLNYKLTSSSANQITLTMNLNEWFESPHLFDFNVDGNYTMAVDSLMEKVSENGSNCFKMELK